MQTMQNTAKQNYHGLFAFYDTRPGNELLPSSHRAPLDKS